MPRYQNKIKQSLVFRQLLSSIIFRLIIVLYHQWYGTIVIIIIIECKYAYYK